MKLLCLFILIFTCVKGQAQRHPYHTSDSIMHHRHKENNDPDYENKATELSWMGDYKNTLIMWDSTDIDLKNRKLAKKDSLYFLKFKPVSAHDYIIERARKERIIILNEAHHQPQHRVFVESLLPDLYKIGYHFLGTETMLYKRGDTTLNKTKYPELSTGYYTVDPRYGNMVRTALQDSYYVFGYEADFARDGSSPTEREIGEARHIKAYLDANPGAKIILYCGYGHLLKSDLPIWEKSMCQRLQEYTGIEPFTIDQVELTEKSTPAYDDPIYRTLNLNYYAVFIDSAGNLYHGDEDTHDYDVRVYHPRTRWVKGRPHWVFENGRKPFFVHGGPNMSYPCLVLAYPEGEDIEKAVPVDVIELKSADDNIALALKQGDYNIVFKDTLGYELQFKAKL